MKDGKFEASAFPCRCSQNAMKLYHEVKHYDWCEANECADTVNDVLPFLKEQWREELLRDAPVVYGQIGAYASTWSSYPPGTFIQENSTHTAKLADIKEIEK